MRVWHHKVKKSKLGASGVRKSRWCETFFQNFQKIFSHRRYILKSSFNAIAAILNLAKKTLVITLVYSLTKCITSFFLTKLLQAIAESSLIKTTSHFPRQFKENLEALFKRARNLFGSEI